MTALVSAYLDTDASLAEINPLMVTGGGDVMALDAKMNFDDNALFRHKDIAGDARPGGGGPAGGRGLASSTSTTSSSTATSPAWSTAPGSPWRPWTSSSSTAASRPTSSTWAAAPAQEAVKNAFRILVSDPNVKAVLINIFGGIARTDRIARGVVGAIEELGNVKVPVVVRLEGTNVEEGRRILREAAFKFLVAAATWPTPPRR